ncbi:CoB--CoM heterodisulfide reductase iron-sulfur subunit B family protein [Oceanidesulfovibrio marinus]|uniref:Heterodisulfide reductase subunit B n=1 Tax=Oceanidesulfovibrio marinus TaxID=370038 RepID=A0ABX6NER2_9BACT|nr:CoB--CoM heterodisulfide reductase iron-sulfur subunit B family protein [Oceanidesulfovibrio marinus]QJT08711.1 heterodisulfide reductase subunit B [Oceanidesulfovibrio marinus]
MSEARTYGYYPGCSGMGTSMEYERSTRAVCEALGIKLVELEDWSCCGSTPAHTVDHVLSAALSGRNLSIAESMGLDTVITPCPSCLTNLKTATHRMENPEFRSKVDKLLDKPAPGGVAVKSVLQVIFEDVGPDAIREKVVRPLDGLALAPYYGCLMNRPPEVMQFDDPENPTSMDEILKALGADVVPYGLKVECCGASHGIAQKDVVTTLSGRLLDLAYAEHAVAMVTACPLCQMNLDLRQGQINSANKTNYKMPIFYYTQLLGIALGLPEKELGFDKLAVNPAPVLKAIQEPSHAAS